MGDKISVIVPIYNVEKYLRQCLDSIVNQTYRNLEIILVDDGSPDRCGIICDEYAGRDARITVIHKENAGVSAARNDGIDLACGKWALFVDPDDWLELDCCERVLETANKYSVNAVYFRHQINNDRGEALYQCPEAESFLLDRETIQKLQLDCLMAKEDSMGFSGISPWAKFFRLKFLREQCCHFPVGIKKRQDVIFNFYCREYLQSLFYFNYVGYHNRANKSSICFRYNTEMLDITLSFLYELERFVSRFHTNEPLYTRGMGVQTSYILADVERLFFFYPKKALPYRDYLNQMDIYYNNPTVKKYIPACRISDFYRFNWKIRSFFVSRRWLFPYYLLRRLYGAVKKNLI